MQADRKEINSNAEIIERQTRTSMKTSLGSKRPTVTVQKKGKKQRACECSLHFAEVKKSQVLM